jgi:integrase
LLAFLKELSLSKTKDGRPFKGTRTFHGIKCFLKMAFSSYAEECTIPWTNPFQELHIKPFGHTPYDALEEEETCKLLNIDFDRPIEKAVCYTMFLCGLRKQEIFALKMGDLDFEGGGYFHKKGLAEL